MKFSAIYVIPEQSKTGTPDDYLTNSFGKEEDINLDGALTTSVAIRLSRLLSRNLLAFKSDNSIITGFTVEDVQLINDDLLFTITTGRGVIDATLMNLPINISCVWPNFKNEVPKDPSSGQVILYIIFKYSTEIFENRPLPQDHVQSPTVPVDPNQATFNPFQIAGSFYDANSKAIVGEDWNDDNSRIILTSQIFYSWSESDDDSSDGDSSDGDSSGGGSSGELDLNIDYDGTIGDNLAVTNPDGSTDVYLDQQGGGSGQDLDSEDPTLVDGGILSGEYIETNALGINILFDEFISSPDQLISKDILTDEWYLFLNGVLYGENFDWTKTLSNQINISHPTMTSRMQLFIFESVPASNLGYIERVFAGTTTSQELHIIGISSSESYLMFYNGLLLDPDDYLVSEHTISFNFTPENDKYLLIIRLIENSSIKTLYDGPVLTTSQTQTISNMVEDRKYLIFYNGVLYQPYVDYTIIGNKLTFQHVKIYSNKYLKVVMV